MKESYFYQALKQVAGANPPEFMKSVTVSQYYELDESLGDYLQTWAVDESNLPWCTGMGVIEAAMRLVKDAKDNANIIESDHAIEPLCLSRSKHMWVAFGSPSESRCNWCGCRKS